MQSSIFLNLSPTFPPSKAFMHAKFRGLPKHALCSSNSSTLTLTSPKYMSPKYMQPKISSIHRKGVGALSHSNGTGFHYDLLIIGADVAGHAAALHAVEKGLKTAIIEDDVIGGTSVNKGCVLSRASLAVSGSMSELQNEEITKSLGLQVAAAGYDRQGVADHASSLKALGVDILLGAGTILGPQKVKYGSTVITAKDVIIATGSVPAIPTGTEVDGKTVITTDHAVKLKYIPDRVAIIGSGYIGFEFTDVYNALGSKVTFVEALDQLMPSFDPDIEKLAQRILMNNRKIDYLTGVFASKITPAKNGKPVTIELIDAKTKEPKGTLEVDAALIATRRAPYTKGLGLEDNNVQTEDGFVPVDGRMRVLDANRELVPHLYCIGDANRKMMLAHASSVQGISVVEQTCGNDHVLSHLNVPAACFTHPKVSMVGYTEPQAREKAEKEGFEITVVKTSFKVNTKAFAENEGEGLAKLIYRADNGEILGVHIFGMHAADLIYEVSNAIAMGTRIQDMKFTVHMNRTSSEVMYELFKSATVYNSSPVPALKDE